MTRSPHKTSSSPVCLSCGGTVVPCPDCDWSEEDGRAIALALDAADPGRLAYILGKLEPATQRAISEELVLMVGRP